MIQLPTEGVIKQVFDTPVNYIEGRTHHEAIDIVTNGTKPIKMIASCVVIKVVNKYDYYPNQGFGNELWVQYSNGDQDRFCHCARNSMVPVGTRLEQGKVGAWTGQTGYRDPITLFHTHWERYRLGRRIDPLNPNNQPNSLSKEDMEQLDKLRKDHEDFVHSTWKRDDSQDNAIKTLQQQVADLTELVNRMKKKKLGKEGVEETFGIQPK